MSAHETISQSVEARNDIAEFQLHQNVMELDASASLYDPQEIGVPEQGPGDSRYAVVAELGFGGKLDDAETPTVAILSATAQTGERSFYIATLQNREDGGKQVRQGIAWTPIQPGRTYLTGRNPANKDGKLPMAFSYLFSGQKDTNVSRKHAEFLIENGKFIIADTSANGTAVRGKVAEEQQSTPAYEGHDYGVVAEHTIKAHELAKAKGLARETAEGNMFGERLQINRDTTEYEGRVDTRPWVAGAEAIVIDSASAEFTTEYARLQQKAVDILNRSGGRDANEGQVIDAIFQAVSGSMEYSLDDTDKIASEAAALSPELREVNLGKYLREGKGVCRHMGLAVGWLGERFARAGLLKGKFTVEVNQIYQRGAHEWARYTPDDPTDKVYILDPAQKFSGTLEEALIGNKYGRKQHWEYFRPGEKAQMEAAIAARTRLQTVYTEDGLIGGYKPLEK